MGEAIKGKQQEFQDMCPILLAVTAVTGRRTRPLAAVPIDPLDTSAFHALAQG
jgi:hypothetical protein